MDGPLRRATVVRRPCQLLAGLSHREQMAAEIAAVHGGYIHRQQRRARLRVVPVQKVTEVARQCDQRSQRGLHPAKQLLRTNPAKLSGASHAEQVQADIGGRGTVRHHVVWCGLQIVWRQMVVVCNDVALKKAPGITRNACQIWLNLKRQSNFLAGWTDPTHPPDPYR